MRARDGGQWKRSGRYVTFLTIEPTYDKFSLAALHMQIYYNISLPATGPSVRRSKIESVEEETSVNVC